MGKSTKERLLSKIKINEETGCWEWTGGISSGYGYGNMCVGGHGVKQMTHRIAYTVFKGEIPEGLLVLHKCDNGRCCNPDHLFLGTQKDNVQDCIRKGRRIVGKRLKGETNPNSKITEDDVREIRKSKLCLRELSEIYGVSICIISKVKRRIYWAHVK